MQFGLFHNLHDLTRQRDYVDLLDELRELATICDETDFDVLWMPEHHWRVGTRNAPQPADDRGGPGGQDGASGSALRQRS